MQPTWWDIQWHQLVWTLVTHAPTIFLGVLGITVFGLGPIGRGIGARLRGEHAKPLEDPSLPALKSAMSEVLERLDFSERVLSDLHRRTLDPTAPSVTREEPPEETPA